MINLDYPIIDRLEEFRQDQYPSTAECVRFWASIEYTTAAYTVSIIVVSLFMYTTSVFTVTIQGMNQSIVAVPIGFAQTTGQRIAEWDYRLNVASGGHES